jgi:hypothetical protein
MGFRSSDNNFSSNCDIDDAVLHGLEYCAHMKNILGDTAIDRMSTAACIRGQKADETRYLTLSTRARDEVRLVAQVILNDILASAYGHAFSEKHRSVASDDVTKTIETLKPNIM